MAVKVHNRRIALDRLVGAPQDRRRRTAIRRHGDALHPLGTKGAQELVEGSAGCAAELVDRLIGIADCEDVGFVSGKQAGQLDLRDVGILELVDQDEARPLLCPFEHRLTPRQHIDGPAS